MKLNVSELVNQTIPIVRALINTCVTVLLSQKVACIKLPTISNFCKSHVITLDIFTIVIMIIGHTQLSSLHDRPTAWCDKNNFMSKNKNDPTFHSDIFFVLFHRPLTENVKNSAHSLQGYFLYQNQNYFNFLCSWTLTHELNFNSGLA